MEYVNDNTTLRISKRWHSITPLPTFVGNQNMKNIMEKANWQNISMGGVVMGKCEDKQKSLALLKQIVNILKEDMEDYNWAMFTRAMDFFKECASLKKLILE